MILGGSKRHFFGLRARCEIKWAKVHGIEKKTLHLVSCKTRVKIPYVISFFVVRNFFLLSGFRRDHFFRLRSNSPAYTFRLFGRQSEGRAGAKHKRNRSRKEKVLGEEKSVFAGPALCSCHFRQRDGPTAPLGA